LSAAEFGNSTNLYTDNYGAFSVDIKLSNSDASTPLITIPLVQGSGFTTAIYSGASVLIQSGLFFTQLSPATKVGSSTTRWQVLLTDGHVWAIYITPDSTNEAVDLTLVDSKLQGPANFNGLIQIAKIDVQGQETVYDASAGVYPVSASVSATSDGSYSINWSKAGDTSKTLVMFALPHHIASFSSSTATGAVNITLDALAKGTVTAVVADKWDLVEQVPTGMGFAPWSPTHQSATVPAAAIPTISQAVQKELNEDMQSQINLNSVYFSGKGMAKFASLIYVANDITNDTGLAAAALLKLEEAFALYTQNKAVANLVYDTVWKGVVGELGYSDVGADFGCKLLEFRCTRSPDRGTNLDSRCVQ
jgi:endo-1,3(4)-beta-glucanase